ncbi:oxidoreductase [Streptomyces erythrochromogenes]|uniref:oxidoreductase n=1 Tax=Streptomyces erythrochromogenes TaxID=285574 RepID=UPI0036B070EB
MPQWGGGWVPPAAPKPGVIPLQPLSLGDILGGAFTSFRRYWKPLVGMMLAVQGIGFLLVTLAVGIAVAVVFDRFSAVFDLPPGESAADEDVMALLLAFVPAAVLLLITLTVGAALISALGPAVIQEGVLGRPATFGAMWRRCWSRLPSVLGTVLLTGLIAGAPMLLLYAVGIPLVIMSADGSGPPAGLFVLILGALVCLPFSVWIATRLSLAPAAAVCEGLGTVAALRRSAHLVKDGWWRAFGITMLGYLVAMAVGYAIQMPFSFVGMAAFLPSVMDAGETGGDTSMAIAGLGVYVLCIVVGGLVSGLFQFGFPPLVLALLYVDLRMRKENFAQTLIAATAPSATAGAATPTAAAPPPADAPSPEQM